MTEPNLPNDLTLYPISNEISSIPDLGFVRSVLDDYDQKRRIQLHTLGLQNRHLQNQVNDLSQDNFTLSEKNKVLLQENIILNKELADAKNENECLARSLAYAKREILHLRSSQHRESLDGEFYEDWENHRYEDE